MPTYTFKCNTCDYSENRKLSISEYLDTIEQKSSCVECNSGVLFQQLRPVNSKIERRKEEIMMESKNDVRRIVDKIKSGDAETIEDIYGDKPNV